MTKRQTKFGRPDVNDAKRNRVVFVAVIFSCAADELLSPPATTPKTIAWGLRWRGFAVCQNFSNDRRKLINAGTRHDDAVAAPMSFLSDTQEFAAVVLPELDIEMLALNLQFFRLDDVVHFALRPPSLGSRWFKWKKNPCSLREFLTVSPAG